MSEPCRTCKGSGVIMMESIKGSWEEPCPDCFQYTEPEAKKLQNRIKELEGQMEHAYRIIEVFRRSDGWEECSEWLERNKEFNRREESHE